MKSTLRKFSANTSANEAALLHRASSVVTIFVEGENDKRFFQNFLHRNIARIKPVDGRENMMMLLDKLRERLPNHVYCLADIDFDVVRDQVRNYPSLTYVSFESGKVGYEANDLESALFQTGALNKVLSYALNEQDLDESFDEWVDQFREKLRIAASYLGSTRVADLEMNHGRAVYTNILKINPHIWKDIFDPETQTVKKKDFRLAILRGVSQQDQSRSSDFFDLARQYEEAWGQSWGLCRGHDLMAMCTAFLQSLGVEFNSATPLEKMLAISCDLQMLANTKLGTLLKKFKTSDGKPIFSI